MKNRKIYLILLVAWFLRAQLIGYLKSLKWLTLNLQLIAGRQQLKLMMRSTDMMVMTNHHILYLNHVYLLFLQSKMRGKMLLFELLILILPIPKNNRRGNKINQDAFRYGQFAHIPPLHLWSSHTSYLEYLLHLFILIKITFIKMKMI